MFTPYHAKYYAHELTRKSPFNSPEKIGQALVSASVDLNPHQIDAALFALENPLGKGVILADEVGLGKTIEAGLVISQFWAEGKRSVLIIAPKSLRHQWQDELENLFHLDSNVLDGATFKKIQKRGEDDPLLYQEKIIICNEHFVASYGALIKKNHWDLIIIDEAHKLRNVWRKGENQAKRAKAIREALDGKRKLLLTATPMQNSLMELYGLTTFIDDHILGTPESFSAKFMSVPDEHRIERFVELRSRLSSFFHRELRKNITEYIQYTNRNTATFYYSPDDNEERLRIEFEEFLRRPVLLSIPQSALHLLKLVYLKLLASSSFALKNSLLNLYKRLVLLTADSNDKALFDELIKKITEALTLENGRKAVELESFEERLFYGVFPKTFEGLRSANVSSLPDDLEMADDEIENNYTEADRLSEDQEMPEEKEASQVYDVDLIREESELILEFILISRKISDNKKANALVTALKQQFEKAKQEGWPEKAVVFTEFKTTQNYVIKVLESIGLDRHRDIVVFNGGSGDVKSRKALVESFREDKKIFLTTEAGAEGLNLQCCNLIVNYDLPWNPQRIEQRIGRCHRYGQKLDVIVANFVNTKNHADVRVLELLTEKFKLFEGAFGASDEVLGQIESGHDVEKEIYRIYLECRTEEQIKNAFNQLQEKLKAQIEEKIKEAQEIVIEHFDEDVHKKLKMRHESTLATRDEFTANFWRLNKFMLAEHSVFDEEELSFDLHSHPSGSFQSGRYVLRGGRNASVNEDIKPYGLQHPLAQWVIEKAKSSNAEPSGVQFDLTNYPSKIGLLENYKGQDGFLGVWTVAYNSLQPESHVVALGVTSKGEELSREVCSKFFKLSGTKSGEAAVNTDGLDLVLAKELERIGTDVSNRNHTFFNEEMERLDAWAEDVKGSLELEIKQMDREISMLKKDSKKIEALQDKVSFQRKIKALEGKRNKKRRELFDEQDRIEKEKETLLSSLEKRMKVQSKVEKLFMIKWELV